tara:strand:- start:13935 stop:14420 length:486 start_codon:yes stop_codon:yes gene_type:complete
MTKQPYSHILGIFLALLVQIYPLPAFACVEGLSWGMSLSNVEKHLGVSLVPVSKDSRSDIYEVSDFKMSGVPVINLRVQVPEQNGLKQLAYEMDYENMTEVLAGLRHRFGPPVGTSIEVKGESPQQQWVWHTGEDVITAIKREQSPFVLSYRPSLLDPSFL